MRWFASSFDASHISLMSAGSSEHLFATLYDELHRLADSHLRTAGRDLTLSPTTLIHEAWLDLSTRRALDFPDRARFLGYAARAMRGILIDYVRQSRAQKRGGGTFQITLAPDLAASETDNAEELSRLSDALDELSNLEPGLAELVDLHFFCGYSFAEIGELRSVSERTVQRDWRKARMLLHGAILGEQG
jgi:RNA polymerase sigma factor (TIGR02999 family)